VGDVGEERALVVVDARGGVLQLEGDQWGEEAVTD
jgi:hypothetical protein